MKILITGGAGFIGSNLADQLLEAGHQVIVIDDLSTGYKKNINSKAVFYKIDICDARLDKIFKKEKPDIVFHFAAQIDAKKSLEHPLDDARVNILGGLNVLEQCHAYRVKKIIFASSGGAIYGEASILPTPEDYIPAPLSPYGVTKLTLETYLKSGAFSGLAYTCLRFANVYGPRQNFKSEAGVIAIFCDAMLHKRNPNIYGDGSQTRDFVYIDDAVNACMLAMETSKNNIFNIGTAKETSINTLFDVIKKGTGFSFEKNYSNAIKGQQQRSSLNYAKAKKELGWQPRYSLDDGVKKTIAWHQKNGNLL